MKKKFPLATQTLLLAATIALCAEPSFAETGTSSSSLTVKDESFYENLTEADWAMKLTAGTISENTPSDTFVSKTPELEGPTTVEIRALIHVIEAGVKVVSECVSALISATNGVHSKVTISGSQNEEQTGDGIVFATTGTPFCFLRSCF